MNALWDSLRAQAWNTAWANHRLGAACASLPPEALVSPLQNVFPTLIETLNHILIVDWFYVSALEGDCMGAKAFAADIPCPQLPDLRREQAAIDRRLMALFEGPARPHQSVTLIRRGQPVEERFDRVMLHLVQHQIHHRGQAHAMLSGCGITPPQLDEFYLEWEEDRHLRAPDLAAMGLDESALWR